MKTIVFSLCIILCACNTVTKEVEKPIQKVVVEVKPSVKEIKNTLKRKGFEVVDYVDKKTKDTLILQQYFIAFSKQGTVRNQNEEESAALEIEHNLHLEKMYNLGYADLSGPFGDDGDISAITIYNVPTLQMADSLAKSDPMVKSGRLDIEIHPWWATKGRALR